MHLVFQVFFKEFYQIYKFEYLECNMNTPTEIGQSMSPISGEW